MHYKPTAKNNTRLLRILSFTFILILSFELLIAQGPVLRVTNNFNQQAVLYNNDTFQHTAWKPVIYTDSTYTKSNRSWLYRKFFEEHLLQVQHQSFNIFADIVVDEYIGKSKRFVTTPMMNTRGYEVSGNIGSKFYFETALYENQGRFPGYVDSSIRKNKIVPFQARFKNVGDGKGFDFSYSTSRLTFMPSRHFLFDLGYGTNFIGDGYRSLLLSDYNTSYPYLHAAVNFGKFQYSVMWSQYISEAHKDIYALGYPRKWGQTYLLDWHATDHFTIGLFNSVISAAETADHKANSGISLASPIMFLHASESPSGVKSNDLTGVNLKYTIAPKINAYAQGMINKLGSNEWEKCYGYQVGLRLGDIFKISGWNIQAEFNTVRPYTYASDTITTIYAHNNQPLAHPSGANFKELVFVTDFSYKKWWFRLEAFANRYGADSSVSSNFGQNIFKPVSSHSIDDNIKTGQGLHTRLYYGDFRFAYILNSKTNLRLESGFVYRKENNKLNKYQDVFFYIGIRTSFRKLIYDF